MWEENANETSPSSISTAGSGCCRASNSTARRMGAVLSRAAGALDRADRTWRCAGHPGTSYRPMAIRAARPAVRHRQPARRRQQHRHRGGRARARRRPYAPPDPSRQRDQRDALRQAQFRFCARHRAGRGRLPRCYVMVVNPSVPAKTVPEFIAYAKANPGKINMASVGIGSGPHIAGELFKMMVGVNMVHVTYRGGGPALTDLLGGQVQVMFPGTVASIEYIRAGRLRALAVTTATRSEALPGIPIMGEFVPGYEASQWFGIGAPKNTPADIVDKLNTEINAGLADPKIKARLADLGGE